MQIYKNWVDMQQIKLFLTLNIKMTKVFQMKKMIKRIAAIGAAVMMTASISAMGVSANTLSENYGKVGGYRTNSQNRITTNSGQAITTISTNEGVTWVKGEYKVQVIGGYQKYTFYDERIGASGIAVNFSAPANTKTYSLYSYHRATYKSSSWYDERFTIMTDED